MSKRCSGEFTSGVLANGTAVVVKATGLELPATVWVDPAAGDTVTVEYQGGASASWVAWPNGAVTAYSAAVLDGAVYALRFTRSAGAGTTSKYGVA